MARQIRHFWHVYAFLSSLCKLCWGCLESSVSKGQNGSVSSGSSDVKHDDSMQRGGKFQNKNQRTGDHQVVDMLILSQESLPFGRRIIVITSNQTPDIPIICVNLLRLEPSCSHVLQLKKAVSILQYWLVPNLKHLWDGTWSAMYLGPPVAGLLQPTAQLAKCKHVQGMQ